MMAVTLLLVLAALAASATTPSLRAEFSRQTVGPRAFNGTVVVVAGATLASHGATVTKRSFQFVDDATGHTHELTWAEGATKIPRQSMHGTLDATYDGVTYAATHFESGGLRLCVSGESLFPSRVRHDPRLAWWPLLWPHACGRRSWLRALAAAAH
jgi:hypothetical protein